MHWFLRFSPVHLWTHRTIPHLYMLVPICHSGRWAFHHILTVHSTTISLQMLYLTSSSPMHTHHDGITHAGYAGPYPPALTTDPVWSDVLTIWCMLEIKETIWLSITQLFSLSQFFPLQHSVLCQLNGYVELLLLSIICFRFVWLLCYTRHVPLLFEEFWSVCFSPHIYFKNETLCANFPAFSHSQYNGLWPSLAFPVFIVHHSHLNHTITDTYSDFAIYAIDAFSLPVLVPAYSLYDTTVSPEAFTTCFMH